MLVLGSEGGWGAIFTLNFNTRVAQKLCRIIQLRFGLIAFRSHFPRIRKVFIFMISRPSGCVHDPQNQLSSTLETPNYLKQYKAIPIPFRRIWFGKFSCLGNRTFWKRRVPGNPWGPSYKFCKNLNVGSRSFKNHELEIWYQRNLSNLKVFYFQLKESFPPHPSPMPTLASAHPSRGPQIEPL